MSCQEKVRIVRKLMPDFQREVKEVLDLECVALKEMQDRSVGIVMRNMFRTCECIMNESKDDKDEGIQKAIIDRSNELEVVIEFIWEQLNIGHWKQVADVWRKLYSLASFFKVILILGGDGTSSEAIKVCDLGLLLGAPILNNILSKLAFRLHLVGVEESEETEASKVECKEGERKSEIKKPEFILRNQFPSRFQIDAVLKPSIETFVQEFFLPQKPVLLGGVIQHWPAMKRWSVEYIKQRAGSRTVPIEIGSKYTSEEWTQKLVTMQDFIDNYILSSSNGEKGIGYLAQHQLFLQIPELMQDLGIPEYCYVGNDSDVEINAWFGPSGTVSPAHFDPKHNLLVQIFGEKIIRLFPPSEWEKLYPHDAESMLFNTSQIDVESAHFSIEFPNSVLAKYADVILEPGMTLYMPPKWAHFVKSLSPSFSVSYWFQ